MLSRISRVGHENLALKYAKLKIFTKSSALKSLVGLAKFQTDKFTCKSDTEHIHYQPIRPHTLIQSQIHTKNRKQSRIVNFSGTGGRYFTRIALPRYYSNFVYNSKKVHVKQNGKQNEYSISEYNYHGFTGNTLPVKSKFANKNGRKSSRFTSLFIFSGFLTAYLSYCELNGDENDRILQQMQKELCKLYKKLKKVIVYNFSYHCFTNVAAIEEYSSTISDTEQKHATELEEEVKLERKITLFGGILKLEFVHKIFLRLNALTSQLMDNIRSAIASGHIYGEKFLKKYNEHIREPGMVLIRFIQLVMIFIPIIATYPVTYFGEIDDKKDGETKGTLWWYKFFANQMKIAGPTFVKLSQWAATRSDVFPPQFCAELSHLHSKNKPHKFIHTKKCIAETYGGIKDIEAIFEWIEEEPIGAGAIAQVHKAKLREEAVDYIVARSALYFGSVTDTSTGEAGENGIFVSTGPVSITLEDNSTARKEYTGQDSNSSVDTNAKQSTSNRPNLKLEVGQHCVLTKDDLVNLKETLKKNREVAIKVLHPDSEKLVLRDLKIMSFFAKTLCYIPTIKWLSLVEEVMVFGQMMKSQLNLREEASNLLVFSKNFSEQKGVRFPVPLLPITGKQVLVETYSDGVPVSVFMKNAGSEFDKIIASAGLDSFMRMMIWDNFTHADLHPGNILVSFVPPPPLSRSLRLFNKLTRKIDPKSFEPAILDSVEGKEFESIKNRIDLDNLPTESEVNRTVAELSKTKTELLAYLDQLYTLGYRPDLVYLDAGLVTVLNDVHRRNFLELFDAICSFDGERAGYAMIERCTSPELVVEPEIYAKKIEQMVENVRLNSLSLGKVSASSILNQTMDAVRQHRVKLDPNSVNLCVAILVVEGIGRKLYPDLDLLRASLPILRDFFRFEAQSRILNQQKNPPSMIPPPSGSEDSATSVFSGINLDMLKIWVYVEAREYFDRVVNWGSDEAEFFGPFAPALSFYF